MKGTSPRGRNGQEDAALCEALALSAKERAENAMIVDMMRNDLARVARRGSVEVRSAFDVEKYPTLLQMTSTVAAKTAAPVVEIFRALLSAGFDHRRPKVRTMQIIRELEPDPRGVYTGCIGYLVPSGRHNSTWPSAPWPSTARPARPNMASAVALFGTRARRANMPNAA